MRHHFTRSEWGGGMGGGGRKLTIKMRTNAKMHLMLEESGVKTLERPRKIRGKNRKVEGNIMYIQLNVNGL